MTLKENKKANIFDTASALINGRELLFNPFIGEMFPIN